VLADDGQVAKGRVRERVDVVSGVGIFAARFRKRFAQAVTRLNRLMVVFS
jgi:hypothetical protein